MKKTMLLSAAILSASLSATTFAGEITRSFTIDDSHQTLDANANGYFEFDDSAFRISNIAVNGVNNTYYVGNPEYPDQSPGDATYYINDAKVDHTYKFSFTFFGWPNRAEDQKFTIHKLDGTSAEVHANLKRGTKAINQISLDGEYTGVSHITISNVASNQGTANVNGSGYGTGWVLADLLGVTEYAPDDTSGGGGTGGGTPALCPIYDYEIDWSGLVESASGEGIGFTYTDVIGDVNQDGIEDRMVSSGGNLRVQFMNADLTYVDGPSLGVTAYRFVRKAGDFNKDGIPDIMTGTRYGIQMIALDTDGSMLGEPKIIQPSQGGLNRTFKSGSTFGYDAVAYGDEDGDGYMDTYVTTVPHHADKDGKGGVLLFQIDETGTIPNNQFKWLPGTNNSGYYTVDVAPYHKYSKLTLLVGDDPVLNTRKSKFGTSHFHFMTLNNNLDVVKDQWRTVYGNDFTKYVQNLNRLTRTGYVGDFAYVNGLGIAMLSHAGSSGVYTGSIVIANIAHVNGSEGLSVSKFISRGVNNMPPLLDGAMDMKGTSVSVFHNFANTGKTVLNVGGYTGIYTVTLENN